MGNACPTLSLAFSFVYEAEMPSFRVTCEYIFSVPRYSKMSVICIFSLANSVVSGFILFYFFFYNQFSV